MEYNSSIFQISERMQKVWAKRRKTGKYKLQGFTVLSTKHWSNAQMARWWRSIKDQPAPRLSMNGSDGDMHHWQGYHHGRATHGRED